MNKISFKTNIAILSSILMLGCDSKPMVHKIADVTGDGITDAVVSTSTWIGNYKISEGPIYFCIGRKDSTFEIASPASSTNLYELYTTKDSAYAWDGKVFRNITKR